MGSAPPSGIRAQAQQFIRKLWCRNKSMEVWSYLCRSFHCTPGNKHVTFSSGKLHTALGFVQHRRLDVVGLGFMPGRANAWWQMLYSCREFLKILSHHIGLCDKTKQKTTLISYLSFSVFLEESLCLLKAEIKVTVSSQIGRKIAENYIDSFYFIWGNGQTGRKNKEKMEMALKDKWLENLHIWKNKPVCLGFFAYTSCIYSSYSNVLHWKK